MNPNAKMYPVVFTFPDVIVGKGYTARVVLNGHALVEEVEGSTWIYGVQPGGIAGGGKDWSEARRAFKECYLSVAFDLALEAADYDDFHASMQAFFAEVNEPNRVAWDSALESIRRTPDQLEGCSTVRAEDHPPALRITKLDQRSMNPGVNQFDAVEVAQAAA